MRLRLACIIFLVAASLTAATIVNPSFETPSVGAGSFQYNPLGATWTFSGASGISSNGSAFGFLPAPNGTQEAFLQGSTGSFSQAITGVNVGDMISFFISQRPGFVAACTTAVSSVALRLHQQLGRRCPLRFQVLHHPRELWRS